MSEEIFIKALIFIMGALVLYVIVGVIYLEVFGKDFDDEIKKIMKEIRYEINGHNKE